MQRAFKKKRRISWLLLLAMTPRGVFSQTAELEEIVVTGTRIARPDFSSASPVVSLPAKAFSRRASTTVETTLNEMPQFVPSFTSTSQEFGAGEATADLRGLGSPRTLVLLDGRRLVAARGDGVADLNVIPSALIQSVEVVSGGASAVYGSDAIAGVVNFRLNDHFEGIDIDGRWGETDRGDGEEYDVSLTAGTAFAHGRGAFTGSIGYSSRRQIDAGARDYSANVLAYLGPGFGVTGPQNAYLPVGSFATEEGAAFLSPPGRAAFDSLFASYGFAAGSVPYDFNWDFGVNGDGTVFTMGNFASGSVVNFHGGPDPRMLGTDIDRRFAYNFAPTLALRMPLERVSAFGSAVFELNENLAFYAQGLYADYQVSTQSTAPVLLDVTMPVTNPYVPADLGLLLASREDPDDPFTIAKRLSILGPRDQDNHTHMHQVTGGLRGLLVGSWRFDVYAQFGESDQTRRRDTEVRRSLALELLYAPDGGQSICGGFDPFGPASIQLGCAEYMRTDLEDRVESRESILEATLTGSPLTLPAGPVSLVFGAAYRSHEYSYDGDDVLAVTLPDGGPDVPEFSGADFGGDDQNTDVYVEAGVPLFGGRPGVPKLETVLGYRHSDYASAGGIDTWKAELLYRPFEPLHVRGSYQRAARAPSINELYEPAIPDFVTFVEGEPCSVGSPQRSGADAAMVEALCVAQGLPASLLPTYSDVNVPVVNGGNSNLDAERATTYTVGIVIQPKLESGWLDDLQVSLDWYSIEIDDAIQFADATEAIDSCYDPALNPGYRLDNEWCTTFSRDAGTGKIVDARGTYLNFAVLRTSGIDLQLDWSIAAGPGRVQAGALVSWIESFQRQASQSAPAEESAGTVGGFAGSYPEWKWTLRLGYSMGTLDIGATWRYVDSMKDGARSPYVDLGQIDVSVPHRDYIALDMAYRFERGIGDGLELRAGIENLTDEVPPIFPSAVLFSTDPSQYDMIGRRYFVGLHYSF